MRANISLVCLLAPALLANLITWRAQAEDAVSPKQADFEASVAKAIGYLRSKGQDANGSYSVKLGPGVTALATMAMLKHGQSVDDPQVAKGLKFLEGCVQEDGSITMPKPGTINYDTSLCVACFSLANKDGRYKKIIEGGQKYLQGAQRDEGDNRSISDSDYGGLSYTPKTPGSDLSNTAMLLDALQAAGTSPDDESVKKALKFVSRCQNLESEFNTLPFAAKVNDGGFYYSPVGPGYTAAGKNDDGGLRSYGSMTYAGLRSMLYAGVTADDPRVKAAVKWLRGNYTLKENPGLGDAGLYYYYQHLAKSLNAVGDPIFIDAAGVKHDWRAELVAELVSRQSEDGSWVNTNRRWYESDPNLATSFALLALAYCKPMK